jgi:YegS/Rv2252/BmrU family lipid kinase
LKYFLVLNPTAKSGKGRKKWKLIFEELLKNKVDFEYKVSEYAGHSIDLAKDAAQNDYNVVVAVGGDGTINEVLSGIMASNCAKKPSLGILYTGTSPDVCRYHGISLDLKKAINQLINAKPTLTDIGRVCYFKTNSMDNSFESNENMITSHFLCSVNLGIGARIANGSNSGLRKYFGDLVGTFLSSIKSLITYKPANFTCHLDSNKNVFNKTINMTIGKNPYIASGFKVLSPIKHDDGKMYFFSINKFNFFSILTNINKLYKGSFQNHPNNTFKFISSFECEHNPTAPELEFDGDPRGYLPCKISISNKSLSLLR